MNLCALIGILSDFIFIKVFSEIMICDFTSYMEVVSFSQLDSLRHNIKGPFDMPEEPHTSERLLSMF